MNIEQAMRIHLDGIVGCRPMDHHGSLVDILHIVAEVCHIPMNKLISPRRYYSYSRARHIYFCVARELTMKSLLQIGRHCGDRDHTTVMHGLARVDANRAYYEPELSVVMEKAFKRLVA